MAINSVPVDIPILTGTSNGPSGSPGILHVRFTIQIDTTARTFSILSGGNAYVSPAFAANNVGYPYEARIQFARQNPVSNMYTSSPTTTNPNFMAPIASENAVAGTFSLQLIQTNNNGDWTSTGNKFTIQAAGPYSIPSGVENIYFFLNQKRQYSGNNTWSDWWYMGGIVSPIPIPPPAPSYWYINYYGNGGSGTGPSQQTVTQGNSVTLSQNTFTGQQNTVTWNPNGGVVDPTSQVFNRTFIEWNTQANGFGNGYAPGQNITPSSNMSLYAIWAVPYISSLPVPERNSYRFSGWYTSSSGGSSISAGQSVTSNVTYYAQWIAQNWTVTFLDRGTVLKTQVVSDGGSATPPANPVRPGHTFRGWSGSYTNVTGNRTIIAVWDYTPVWIMTSSGWQKFFN